MKKITFFLILLISLKSFSQSNYWNENYFKIDASETVDQPKKFKEFQLNTQSLIAELKKAPSIYRRNTSNVIIELPNEKGEFIKFKIFKKNNFAPELANKYPDILAFTGKSLKGKSIANISYAPSQGLNVAITNPNKATTLIKPVKRGLNNYIIFSRKDISLNFPFECEDVTPIDTNNPARNLITTNDGYLRKYRIAISTTAEFSQFWLDGTETTDTERKAKVLAALNTTLTRINGIFERDFSITLELVANNDQVIYLNTATDPYNGVSNSILQSTLDNVIGDANYDVGHLFHYEGVVHGNAGCIACACTSGSKGSGWTGHSAPDSDNFNLIASHEMGHQFGGWHVQSSSNCRSANGLQEVEPGSGSTIMGYAGICPPNVQSGPDDYFNYVDIRDVIQWTRNDSSCAQLIVSGNNDPTANAGNDYTIPKSTPFILTGSGNDADGDALTYCWEENDPENPYSSNPPSPTRQQGPMFRSKFPKTTGVRYMPQLPDVLAGNLTPTWEVLPSISRTMDFVLTVRDNHPIGAKTASDEMTVTVDASSGPFEVTSQSTSETWNVGDNVSVSWNVANTNTAPVNAATVDILFSIDGGLTYPYTLVSQTPNDGNESFYVPNIPTTTNGRLMVKPNDNIFYAINSSTINLQSSEFVLSFNETHKEACKPNQVVFDFTYNTFLGFSETTTFSALNLPAGASITFNPPTAVNDGTTVQAIVSNTDAIPPGLHNFVIRGTSASTQKNVDVSLQVFDSTIATPVLNTPNNGQTNVDPASELSWNEDINASAYTIEIATDPSFNSIIETNTIDTFTYQASNLDFNTTYYWHVKSINVCGEGAFSTTYNFTTACATPSNITITDILSDRAQIDWVENGNATSWEIEMVEAGSAPTGSGIVINTKPYVYTGLNSRTEYTVYLRSKCGTGNSSNWVASSSFTTAANFCNGDHFYDSGGASGNYSNNEDTITTIAPSAGNNTIIVTFNAFDLESGYDFLKIYDGSDTNAPLIGTYTGTNIPNQIVSNNPNGTLTFHFTSDFSVTHSGWDASVTCLYVSCPTPSNLQASNEQTDSVDLSWVAGGSETNWQIEYGITGFTQGTGTLINTTTNQYTVTGLNPNTGYDFYVKAVCGTNPGDDDSLWLGPVTATTLVSCPNPTNVNFITTYNSAEVAWDQPGSATSWEIEYGNYGFTQGTGTLVQTNSNPYTILNLSPNTSYQVYIRAICGANPGDDDSLWAGPYYFYTQSLPYPDSLTATLNQSNGQVSLTWDFSDLGDPDFNRFYIYRDGALLATSTSLSFTDNLPVYGNYYYYVTAVFNSGESSASNSVSVDWISCPPPTNFVASNVTTNSVDLSWDAGYSETDWQIEYGTSGFTHGTGTLLNINTNPYTLTGLTYSTNYDVYIRAICGANPGDDDSTWVGPVSFTTLCDTFIAPYSDDVESHQGGYNIADCWDAIPNNSTYNYHWEVSSTGYTPSSSTGPNQAHSGTHFYFTEASGYYPGEVAELITPLIDISNLALPQLKFYYHMYGADMGDLHVDVYNNGNWTNDEIVISGQQQSSGNDDWKEKELILSNYSGQIKIRFRGIRGSGYESDMAIDDIQIIEAPTCPSPTNLSVSNTTYSSADISWTNGNSETSWEIEYGLAGFTQGSGTTVSANANPFTLTGLTPSTSYDVYLRAICGANPGDDDSTWVGPVNFSTLDLPKPYNLTADLDPATGEVVLNWNQITGVYEDFSDGVADNWIPVTGEWNVSNNMYNVKQTTNTVSSSYYNQDFSNFELEVKLKKNNGVDCNIGVYFNGDPTNTEPNGDWLNTYALMYCTNGVWKLAKIENGNWSTISSWSNSSYINTGNNWNILKVTYIDGYINIYMNNHLLGSYFDNTFTSGKIGLKMYDDQLLNSFIGNFDYVSITDLSNTTQNYTFNVDQNKRYRNISTSGNCINNDTCGNNDVIGTEPVPVPAHGYNYTYQANHANRVFQHYKIYRDGVEIGTSVPETYTDQLPSYGNYSYYVTTIYDEGESQRSNTVNVSWHGVPNIVVTPTSLTQTLYPDQTTTQMLTVANTGDDDLNFNINITGTSVNYNANTATGNWIYNDATPIASINKNSNQEVTKVLPYTKRTYHTTRNTNHVLILESADNINYYTDALINLGISFTQVNSWNALINTLNDGTNWDLVLVNNYTNDLIDTNTLDNLNIYIQNGGKIIYADWGAYTHRTSPFYANLGVNIVSNIYTPINFSALDPNFILFTQPNTVSQFYWSNNPWNIDGQIVSTINGSLAVANFENSSDPAIVIGANQNTIFNAFQATNFPGNRNGNSKIDIVELLENEINFLIQNSWLSTNITSGTVAAGSSINVEVNFDSAGLAIGTYNGNISISSNDPSHPTVDVPVELIVIENPDSINNLSIYDFRYYPNPFKNNLLLEANQNFKSIKIYALTGQVLIDLKPNRKSKINLDLSKLSVGAYFLEVEIDNHKESMKIIKK